MTGTTLRVVLDQVGEPIPRGVGGYALELTRTLIDTAPRGCEVAGFVPSSPPLEYERIEERLPGLAVLHKSALDRGQLAAAWQHGFTLLPGQGMVHAPSLLAPLRRHDRLNNPSDQVVVTIHEATAFTHPDLLPARTVTWTRAMATRATRYADAIVVPTHATAKDLAEHLDVGDRVRVISGAVSPALVIGPDPDAQAEALGLPARYILTVGGLDARSGVGAAVLAATTPEFPDAPLLLAGTSQGSLEAFIRSLDGDTRAAVGAAVESGRVRALGILDEPELALAYSRATALLAPALSPGTGLVALEAMSFGTPVIHSDAPGFVEVCDGAGHLVARADAATYPTRLAEGVSKVIDSATLAGRLSVLGIDRARAFSWRDTAEKIWQLHADL